MFWGNSGVLRCFTKRIYFGELEFDVFGGFERWVHVGDEEGGPLCV
jgi:hypothetical protein